MKFNRVTEQHWKTVCVIVGCWTFLALLFTPQTYLANLRSPAPLTWVQALVASLTLFYVWAVLTPLVLWLGRRFPFERHLLRNLVIHLLLCGPVALLHIWLLQNVNVLMRANQSKPPLSAKWGADGNSIEVSENATFDTPEGAVTFQTTRKWLLAPDGKTLKIEMTVDGPNGKQQLKRAFIKK